MNEQDEKTNLQVNQKPEPAPLVRVPVPVLCLYGVAAVSLVLYIVFRLSSPFAEWFNTHISAYLRLFLAKLTTWFPFSLAEIIILLLPVVFVFLCIYSNRRVANDWKSIWIWVADICVILAVIFSVFVWNFAAGYSGYSLDKRLGIDTGMVGTDELYSVTMNIADQVNALSEEVTYGENGLSVMPYSRKEMNDRLMEAYRAFAETQTGKGLYLSFTSRVKGIMLSRLMSYTYITGLYTFFTGEANINIDFPDYTLPYTAAHELGHQRGFARENEANFIAYLVCHHSDDPYLRYSGELSMYEYLFNILYSADKNLAIMTLDHLNENVRKEMKAYNDFLDTRENKVIRTISQKFNDTYLKSQGTDGSISYDLVAYLTVAYYRAELN